jgi:cytoskeletal protein CcmA (bactofilin family)
MEDKSPKPTTSSGTDEPGSLENTSTVVEPSSATGAGSNQTNDTTSPAPITPEPGQLPNHPVDTNANFFKKLVNRLGPSIYLLAFIAIIVVAVGTLVLTVITGNSSNKVPTDNNQALTPAELTQLQGSNPVVGDSQENLTIESNTTFNGSILVKDNVSIAGTLKIGGSLNLPGISVSGTSDFGQVNANSLTVAGDIISQGTLTVQKSLSVDGAGTFNGTLSAPTVSTQNLQLNGDLQINQHIITTGGVPSKTEDGSLGNGGTASDSGTDTAGTININTGNNPTAGCYETLTFTKAFSNIPHVVITPTNANAAGLQYYVTPSSSSFSVCGENPSAGQSYTFDYIVID